MTPTIEQVEARAHSRASRSGGQDVRAPRSPEYLNPAVQRIVTSMENESPTSIVGQFCLTSDGQRVIVEKVGAELDSSARAIVRKVEGPKAGTRSTCFVSSLKPLGFDNLE